MEIIGSGFIANGLRPIAHRHARAVAFAAGVSRTDTTDAAEFGREADLLYATIRHCLADGRTLVYLSTASAAMYRDTVDSGREDGPVFPGTPYGRHKLAMESVLTASGAAPLILRLAHVVGPNQPRHQLVPALLAQIRTGLVTIFRGARRDLIDLRDAVSIIDLLLAREIRGEVVNVGSGEAVPIDAVVRHLERRLGATPEHQIVDAGASAHRVSTQKLYRLVPAARNVGFSPQYYRRVLDRYLGSLDSAVAS